MPDIDRKRVRESFDRHASDYDRHAGVQKLVIERITGLLRELRIEPGLALDIGSGTGALLRCMSALYPETGLVGLDLSHSMCLTARANLQGLSSLSLFTGDAEALPFADRSFELVVSTSTFQWLGGLDQVFSETFRVLAADGTLLFAMFGEKTLFELRGSYRKAWESLGRGIEERTHTFPSLSVAGMALQRAGFPHVRLFSEREMELHPNIPALLRSLRVIGAGNAAPARGRGLGERGVMMEMMDIYMREHGSSGVVPATYEVIYGEAVKGFGSG